jgi:choline dehydrogenase-like flavoprotein
VILPKSDTQGAGDLNLSQFIEYNQAHEVPNLFIVDGVPFVFQADKNPTWTILALAWRASDYLIEGN